jgi:hypothetical protein
MNIDRDLHVFGTSGHWVLLMTKICGHPSLGEVTARAPSPNAPTGFRGC